jgi:hypothetical protein
MELTPTDISLMLDFGLIQRTGNTARETNVRMFTVPENRKHRRRLITHTPATNNDERVKSAAPLGRDLNGELKGIAPQICKLRTPIEMRDRVRWPFAACCDFAAYFHHFLLPKDLRKWVFSANGVIYELLTIPTGAGFCPTIAQIYSTALCALVKQRFPRIEYDVYIDNVRFLAQDAHELRSAIRYFFEVTRQFGVDVNETVENVTAGNLEQYEFLGVAYNHKKGTTDLATHLIEKLKAVRLPEAPSLREVLSWYGLLNFCSAVMDVCRAGAYYATKFLRRRTGDLLDQPTRFWPVARSTMNAWSAKILSTPPVIATPHRAPTATIFTDASDAGYGVVVFFADGHTAVFGGTWTETQKLENINVREALAVQIALTHINLRGCACELFIDNTSALECLRKGSSRSFALNVAVGAIRLCEQFPLICRMQYVRSEHNRADLPSRLGLAIASPGHATIWSADSPFLWSAWQSHFSQTPVTSLPLIAGDSVSQLRACGTASAPW